jgi:hypothetical protein
MDPLLMFGLIAFAVVVVALAVLAGLASLGQGRR